MSIQAGSERPPTRLQKRLAQALADPTIRTVTDAAKRAGVSREHASRAAHSVTVQREIEAIQAAQGDTARALRRKSLVKASQNLHMVEHPLELVQIAHHAAGVEEKVGSEESTIPPKADEIALGRRLLIAWHAGRRASSMIPPNVQARYESRIEAMDAALAFYASVVTR